jgi:hypothetical protein
MTIAFSLAAGLACAFYLFVLFKFARAGYQEIVKRRSHSATPI